MYSECNQNIFYKHSASPKELSYRVFFNMTIWTPIIDVVDMGIMNIMVSDMVLSWLMKSAWTISAWIIWSQWTIFIFWNTKIKHGPFLIFWGKDGIFSDQSYLYRSRWSVWQQLEECFYYLPKDWSCLLIVCSWRCGRGCHFSFCVWSLEFGQWVKQVSMGS